MNEHLLSATQHIGNGTGITGSLRETGSCASVEGAVGGATSTACGTFFDCPQREYPTGQPLVFGDLSSGAISVNSCSHHGVPNLLGLPTPVYTGTVQTGAPLVIRVAQTPFFEAKVWLTMRPD